MFGSIPFIPGGLAPKDEPLSRYLPPIHVGIVSTWLQKQASPGSWVLDPFGASPRVALEAAQNGYRVLVTANNPINRFLLEMLAAPPGAEELKAALAELSASYIGNERIEPHIRSLYNTTCNRCGQLISATAFYWEQGNPSPYMRTYLCPNCGDTGEHPCTPEDATLAGKFSITGLHKARALERVVASNDQDRIHVEQALSVYIPRALYAFITIINKIEGLSISPEGQKYLQALLLNAFDEANALWKVPHTDERKRQLNIPRHFREKNIWFAIEEGIDLWCKGNGNDHTPDVPVTIWPELPPSTGGICIYEGRFVSMADSIRNMGITTVCTAIPRPNQAFWTLSALWAGWLWGREAVGSFKSVLRRQRYDWSWHTMALSSVFKQLSISLSPGTSIFGLISEAEPGFVGAALIAAGVAGCHLESMAIRSEADAAQVVWTSEQIPELTQVNPSLQYIAAESAKAYLELRAEPASYLNTIAASFIGITNSWNYREQEHPIEKPSVSGSGSGKTDPEEQAEPTPSLIYSSTYNSAREALSYRSGFLRYTLQEISTVEAANKAQIIQASLFDLDSSQLALDEDESDLPESTSAESRSESTRERPTRSSDVSESTFLWLRDSNNANHLPVTDAYELATVDYLINHPGCTLQEIDLNLCELFPGLLTPDLEYIELCLESYASQDPGDKRLWSVRQEDYPSDRQSDLEQAGQFIHQIGTRLGISSTNHLDSSMRKYIIWEDEGSGLNYWFYPTVSAAITQVVLSGKQPPNRGFIVIPGSRANLLIYKLRRDPRISRAFNPSKGCWRFLKFRHLRSLAESPIMNRENLEQLLELDPITYSTPQILLI